MLSGNLPVEEECSVLLDRQVVFVDPVKRAVISKSSSCILLSCVDFDAKFPQ